MATQRRTALVFGLALLIAALLAVLWTFGRAPEERSDQSSLLSELRPAPVNDSRKFQAERPNESPEATDNPSLPEGTTADPEPAGPTPFVLLLQVVDASGSPLEGLPLQFATRRMWDRPRSHRDVKPFHQATSDGDGKVEVPLQRPMMIYVKSTSDAWHLEAEIDAKAGVVPVLVARAVATVYLSVVTDAGEPWYGQARITAAGDGRQFHVFIREGELAKVERLPIDDLAVLFYECMIGVDEQTHSFSATDIKEAVTIHITLKTNPRNKNGAIEVDATGYTGEIKELRVLIGSAGALTWVEPGVTFRANKVWRSRPLWPQTYTVRIVGRQESDPVWTSDLITVQPREITKVAVAMDQVCTVQVAVVDDQSSPIPGALLLLGEDLLPNFDFLSPAPGSIAGTDDNGTATLGGLRPGRHKFTVAARGYEPHVLEADLAGGELRFLGTVQLAKANGSVTVTLTGMKEKQKYSIMVLKPGGTALHTAKDVETAETTFSGLSLNTYMVAVIAGRGGKPVTATITLVADEPQAAVTLDVSGLIETELK